MAVKGAFVKLSRDYGVEKTLTCIGRIPLCEAGTSFVTECLDSMGGKVQHLMRCLFGHKFSGSFKSQTEGIMRFISN